MKGRVLIFGVGLVVLATAIGERAEGQVPAQPSPAEIVVTNSTQVFSQAMVMQGNSIPRNLLAEAQAIAILPSMLRGAFIFGVQHGRGVLVARDAQGNWQAPRMIQITGGSIGYQIGVQATDLVLVFRTPQSVANLLRGTMKVGVDASAAAGPVGRQTSAATDISMQAEILSYSRARGAFVGVSIDGSSISLDSAAEAMYYQPPGTLPASGLQLLQTIAASTAAAPIPGAVGVGQPIAATGATWVPQGSTNNNMEDARRRLDQATRQLNNGSLDATWQRYLALPAEVYTPNAVISPQAIQPVLSRYESVAQQSTYATLTKRPEFQEALSSLRKLAEVRTASNPSSQLPPPPNAATTTNQGSNEVLIPR